MTFHIFFKTSSVFTNKLFKHLLTIICLEYCIAKIVNNMFFLFIIRLDLFFLFCNFFCHASTQASHNYWRLPLKKTISTQMGLFADSCLINRHKSSKHRQVHLQICSKMAVNTQSDIERF